MRAGFRVKGLSSLIFESISLTADLRHTSHPSKMPSTPIIIIGAANEGARSGFIISTSKKTLKNIIELATTVAKTPALKR